MVKSTETTSSWCQKLVLSRNGNAENFQVKSNRTFDSISNQSLFCLSPPDERLVFILPLYSLKNKKTSFTLS